MPLEKFIDRTDEIGSWTVTRETYRNTDKDAMGEMRMMERYAGVRLGIWDSNPKPRMHEMESEAQRIVNDEVQKPRAQRLHMLFMLELLTDAQTFITTKGLGTKPYHQIELLFKFMANFGVDGPVENIIANNGCTELFHSNLGKAIRRAAWYGFRIHAQVSAYAVSKGISTLPEPVPTPAPVPPALGVVNEHDLEAALASIQITAPPPAASTTTPPTTQAVILDAQQQQALALLLASFAQAATATPSPTTTAAPQTFFLQTVLRPTTVGAPLIPSQDTAAATSTSLPTQAPTPPAPGSDPNAATPKFEY